MTEVMPTTDRALFRTWYSERSLYLRVMLVLWAVALFFLMIALVVNAASGSSSETTTTTSGSSSSYSSGNSTSDYLTDVRAHVSAPRVSDNALLQYGYGVCRTDDQGLANEWATTMVRGGSMDSFSANYIQDSARTYLCN